MRAYKIFCADDDHGQEIRFGETAKQFRGCRPGEFCDCDFTELRVNRAPQFDKYAPGPVTVGQYLAEGWWWTCSGCWSKVPNYEDEPIVSATRAWCNLECFEKDLARTEEYCRSGDVHESFVEHLNDLRAVRDSMKTEGA